MKCLVLAGGFGTRLYPLTIYKAKALLEYKGRPLLSHTLNRIPGNIDISVSCNRKFEADFHCWQENVGRQVELCVEDVWTEEQRKGAVGSLEFWVRNKNITEDLLVIAGDNYFEFDLAEFISAYNGKNVLIAVYDIGDINKASRFGVVSLDGNRIVEFQEKPAQPRSSLVSTGIYVLPPRIFPLLSEYCAQGKRDNLGGFIAHLVERDEVHARIFTETWRDIGCAEDLYGERSR
jgi:glucose-1-phosphate thymidylyltransferase